MSVSIVEFAPHAGLSSDNIDSRYFRVELVHVSPLYVLSIMPAISVPEAKVQIGEVIVGQYDVVSFIL